MQTEKGNTKLRKSHNTEGHAHALTFTCFQNRQFLKSEIACKFLCTAIINARQKHGFHIWAYVIMPEHVHLIIWPPEKDYSISKILHSIKLSSSKAAINYLRENKPEKLKWLETDQKSSPFRFWQEGGGYDRNIYQMNTLRELVEYIHRNPVRRGLVDDPLCWRWSSAMEWEKPGSGLIAVDRESFPVG